MDALTLSDVILLVTNLLILTGLACLGISSIRSPDNLSPVRRTEQRRRAQRRSADRRPGLPDPRTIHYPDRPGNRKPADRRHYHLRRKADRIQAEAEPA